MSIISDFFGKINVKRMFFLDKNSNFAAEILILVY